MLGSPKTYLVLQYQHFKFQSNYCKFLEEGILVCENKWKEFVNLKNELKSRFCQTSYVSLYSP